MRKTVLALGISLDGYIARPDGAYDFLFMPKDFSMADFFASVDTVIMGRKTYEVTLQSGGSHGGGMKSYVLSRTLEPGHRDGVHFTRQTPTELMHEVHASEGKDIWLMGGGEVARDFLEADLVDEIHLGVVPVLLGSGIPLFPPGFQQRNLELIENKTFSRGLISLKYTRIRTPQKSKSRRRP